MYTELMRKIKHKINLFQILIDDKLGNPFLFSYQKMLLKLTIVLLVAVFVVIKGCTIPLLLDNKVMRFFFYSTDKSDKTLYNIGISVIAAYIFYLVQVYIPEKIHCQKQLRIYEVFLGNRHQIIILEEFIKSISVFLQCNKNGKFSFRYCEFNFTSNCGENTLSEYIYKEIFEKPGYDIIEISKLPGFREYDSSYQELLCNLFYKLESFKVILSKAVPPWPKDLYNLQKGSVAILSKNKGMEIQKYIKELSRFSKRLQHLSKYRYIINMNTITILNHKSKSVLDILNEKGN